MNLEPGLLIPQVHQGPCCFPAILADYGSSQDYAAYPLFLFVFSTQFFNSQQYLPDHA